MSIHECTECGYPHKGRPNVCKECGNDKFAYIPERRHENSNKEEE